MAGNRNYHDQVIVDNQIKLRELQKQLPKFCAEFFMVLSLLLHPEQE